jgi:hypothetical protein
MTSTTANNLFGLPTENLFSEDIMQQYNDTCAVKSQEIILNNAGIPVTEEQLRQEACDNGWYSPGLGTPINDIGYLLESHGIDVAQVTNASMYNLVSELSKGMPVLVGVDSGELWNPGIDETFEDLIYGPQADHALLVGGIEFNDDFSDGVVNIIDPGTGDFCKEYPISQFEDAWDDSGNFMLMIENDILPTNI